MSCEIYGEEYDCATCCEPYCPHDIERIFTEHAELKKAVEDAAYELEVFVEEFRGILLDEK